MNMFTNKREKAEPPVWQWAHDDFPYHIDADPNDKFIIPLSYCKYLNRKILYT